MSRDHVLVCDDNSLYSMDNLCTEKWLRGQVVGANEVIDWFLEYAVELFRKGKVAEATALRKLAVEAHDDVVPKLEARAADHERDYPARIGVKANGE
jgi:hypothetical protein